MRGNQPTSGHTGNWFSDLTQTWAVLQQYLKRLRQRTESKRLGHQGYSDPIDLCSKRPEKWSYRTTADGPHGAGHIDPLQQGKEKAASFPSHMSSLQLWCASVAACWRAVRHLTKITSGPVCPIKTVFAGPNWAAWKHKTPNKEATGKVVYIPPLFRNR